jgi:stage V sporulation protein B
MDSMPRITEPRSRRIQVAESRPLAMDVLMTFSTKAGVVVLNVVGAVVVARALGPTGRGAVAVAFTFTLLLIQFGILGLHSANTYFAAREPDQIPRILANTLWASGVIGATLALVGLGVYLAYPGSLRGLDTFQVVVLLVGIPAALAKLLLPGILLAEGRMVAYNGIEVLAAATMTAGLLLGLGILSFGVSGAIALFVTVNLGASTAYFVLLVHHRPWFRLPELRLFRTMLQYGARIYLAALLAYLVERANLLLVNAFHGNFEAGQFSIAIGLGEAVYLLPTVVGLNLFPRVARGHPSGDTGAVFRSLTLIYALLCVATIPLAGFVIRLLYGPGFSDAVPIYYWLLPGTFCYGMISLFSYHFAGRGFPRQALIVWLSGVALNFAIVIPLLAAGGGARYAALSASLALALILVLHVRLFAAESGGYASLVPRPRETLRLTRQIYRSFRPSGPAAP